MKNSEFKLENYIKVFSQHKTLEVEQTFFSKVTHFIIAYYISLVKDQTNYCNNNLSILDEKQLNKIIKLYYFHSSKALWDGQGKIKVYYGMSRVKKQLSGKRSIISIIYLPHLWYIIYIISVLYKKCHMQLKACFYLYQDESSRYA